jgi:prolyl-tRNA editing enzyme YbaK/EbsC (Cys-tRNA(Pro) deacylase)
VPPFGRPIFELPLFADQALVDAPEIVFTTGAHTRSARMATEDWLRLATPERVWTFARPG